MSSWTRRKWAGLRIRSCVNACAYKFEVIQSGRLYADYIIRRTAVLSACRLRVVPADCFAQQLRGVGELKLLLDASAIGLNGLDADVQRLRDPPCFITLPQQPKDFEFPIAQFLDGRMEALQVFLAESFREYRLHPRTDVHF